MSDRLHSALSQFSIISNKKPSHVKNSLTLSDLPPLSSLHLSDNKILKTRVFSELASIKLKSHKSSASISGKSLPPLELKDYSQSDQSLLLSTLGVMSNSSARNLPKDLNSLKDILANTKTIDKLSLGNPATRKDTTELANWLDSMLKTALSENNENVEGLFETAIIIYEVCFYEIVRQVSVQCVERGDLINRVWKAYLGILEKALKISKAVQEYQLNESVKEKKHMKEVYMKKINDVEYENDELKEEIERLKRVVKSKEDEMGSLVCKEVRINEKMQIIQKYYENCKRDFLYLQEDNRIAKAKLLNSNIEFVENSKGVIEPRLMNITKIKRKTDAEIDRILKSDPLLSTQMLSNIKSESLTNSISKYEDFTRSLMNRVDFEDKNEGTETECSEKDTQTDIISHRRSKGEITNGLETEDLELIKLKVENISEYNEDIAESRSQTEEAEEDNKLSTESYINQVRNKITQVNALLERMKTNIEDTAPSSHQKDILNNFYSAVTESINKMKSTKEEANEVPFTRSRRTKMLTFIHRESKVIKKPTLDMISTVTQKIINTPAHKLKSIVFKKILMKMITGFYDAKVKKVLEGDKKQDLGQIVIENYYKRYGMPKVVEGRFCQLCASCIKYKSIKRVYTFGRFLKLFNSVTFEEFNFYIDSVGFFKNIIYTENLEEAKITYDKCIEWFKGFLPGVMNQEDRLKIKVFIENYKQLDNSGKGFVVDVDLLLDYGIDVMQMRKAEHLDFLNSIYEAGDVIDI